MHVELGPSAFRVCVVDTYVGVVVSFVIGEVETFDINEGHSRTHHKLIMQYDQV
jgi:hypothetical protein